MRERMRDIPGSIVNVRNMNLREPTPEELDMVEGAVLEFRSFWAAMRPPFTCAFDGTAEDIQALDYLDYEVGYPPSDIWGAALVWGEVLRRHGSFRWRVTDRGDFLLDAAEDAWPRLLLWPFARIFEAQNSSSPLPGERFGFLTEKVVEHCLASGVTGDDARRLSALIAP